MPLVQNPEYTRAYSKWCGLCLEHDQAVNNAKAGNAGCKTSTTQSTLWNRQRINFPQFLNILRGNK